MLVGWSGPKRRDGRHGFRMRMPRPEEIMKPFAWIAGVLEPSLEKEQDRQ